MTPLKSKKRAARGKRAMEKIEPATSKPNLTQLDKEFNKIIGSMRGHFVSARVPSTQDVTEDNFGRMLEEVILRYNFIGKHLSSKTALSNHLRTHKTRDIIKRRITQTVKGCSSSLARAARTKKPDTADDEYDRYCSLVQAHTVNPSSVFTELPDTLTLCQLRALWYWYQGKNPPKKGKKGSEDKIGGIIEEALKAKLEFLTSQWKAITGTDFDFVSPPRMSDIDRWKAPVPYRPAWTEDLYGLEAAKMNHKPAIYKEDSEGVSSARVPERPAGERAAGSRSEETPGDADPCQKCNFAELYELAGGRLPKQPGSGPNDKLYTFPGQLLSHENIFYDYSLIIPIQDCGPYSGELTLLNQRNLTAARILIGKAQSVIKFLKDAGLSRALGEFNSGTVTEDVQVLLTNVLALTPSSGISLIRSIRARLKEMAGLMRLAARSEMFISGIPGGNPSDILTDLSSAISAFPEYALKTTTLPTTDSTDQLDFNTLYFPKENKAFDYHGVTRENKNGCINVPSASKYSLDPEDLDPGDPGGWKWFLQGAERFDLRNYVRYLADDVYPKLNDLISSARRMTEAVRLSADNREMLDNDYRRLATGIVNEAARALSYLLGETADVLTLPPVSTPEGTKRLALQIIFRQYWYPDGYVMGKLVGYKNLLPNQKESMKRRTFIKTTRELVKAEEFATSRQDEYSRSQKETAEVIKETSRAFNFTQNISGHFDVKIWGVQAETQFGLNLTQTSKSTQSMISEATMKGSASYSDKREVKVRELQETEDVQEVASEVSNLNREITANYFYYQLLRQYQITMDLNDIRPILLRKRSVPSQAEIDEEFVSNFAHILLHCLPSQLSADAQESADQLEGLARKYLRKRSEMYDAGAKLESFRKQPVPDPQGDTPGYNRHVEEMRSREREFGEAKSAYSEAEDQYTATRARMSRVIRHLRDNICHYMQYIWQASPKVDEDELLQDESFYGEKLPSVTRGLSRLGYFGDEEIFEYTGPSVALMDLMLSHLTPGNRIIEALSAADLEKTSLFQYLKRYYPEKTSALKDSIRSLAFVTDPAPLEEVFPARSVQIAQDALVVETMPGQVPLLEGFQMAHRMLDVQRACLENVHLSRRIEDRPWKKEGDDSYSVRRYEGDVPPNREVVEKPADKE